MIWKSFRQSSAIKCVHSVMSSLSHNRSNAHVDTFKRKSNEAKCGFTVVITSNLKHAFFSSVFKVKKIGYICNIGHPTSSRQRFCYHSFKEKKLYSTATTFLFSIYIYISENLCWATNWRMQFITRNRLTWKSYHITLRNSKSNELHLAANLRFETSYVQLNGFLNLGNV